MSKEENGSVLSVGWVAILVALVIAFFVWGFLAAEYQQSTPGISGNSNFWANAFQQMPRFFSVVSFAFAHMLWLVLLFVVLEVGVFFGWLGLKKLGKAFAGLAVVRNAYRSHPVQWFKMA